MVTKKQKQKNRSEKIEAKNGSEKMKSRKWKRKQNEDGIKLWNEIVEVKI